MKPKKQRSSLVISFLHSTLHTFILYRSTTGSQKVEAQFSKLLGTNFNNDKNLEEKLPKLLPGLELCSKALFLSTFTSASPSPDSRRRTEASAVVAVTNVRPFHGNDPDVRSRSSCFSQDTLDGPHTLTLRASLHVRTPNISAAVPDQIRLQLHVSYLCSSSGLF